MHITTAHRVTVVDNPMQLNPASSLTPCVTTAARKAISPRYAAANSATNHPHREAFELWKENCKNTSISTTLIPRMVNTLGCTGNSVARNLFPRRRRGVRRTISISSTVEAAEFSTW
jgi:hypothetical protein